MAIPLTEIEGARSVCFSAGVILEVAGPEGMVAPEGVIAGEFVVSEREHKVLVHREARSLPFGAISEADRPRGLVCVKYPEIRYVSMLAKVSLFQDEFEVIEFRSIEIFMAVPNQITEDGREVGNFFSVLGSEFGSRFETIEDSPGKRRWVARSG